MLTTVRERAKIERREANSIEPQDIRTGEKAAVIIQKMVIYINKSIK
jgi:hypothetical protein